MLAPQYSDSAQSRLYRVTPMQRRLHLFLLFSVLQALSHKGSELTCLYKQLNSKPMSATEGKVQRLLVLQIPRAQDWLQRFGLRNCHEQQRLHHQNCAASQRCAAADVQQRSEQFVSHHTILG